MLKSLRVVLIIWGILSPLFGAIMRFFLEDSLQEYIPLFQWNYILAGIFSLLFALILSVIIAEQNILEEIKEIKSKLAIE